MHALFACQVNRSPINQLKQCHKYDLLEYKQQGIKKVFVLASQGCDECKKLDKKEFNIKDLLPEQDILPNIKCTHKLEKKHKHSWCRCIFLPVI